MKFEISEYFRLKNDFKILKIVDIRRFKDDIMIVGSDALNQNMYYYKKDYIIDNLDIIL
jgi:hypothetical protein